jgi:hypothetical protein
MSMRLTPQEMAQRIGAGLLSFPVTPFKAYLSFDEARYRDNLDWLCGYVDRHPQPGERLRSVDRQGRHEGDRP